jgi:hypothetical protein
MTTTAQLHVSASGLPPLSSADGTPEPSSSIVLLAALFEKDTLTGKMKLKKVTPWTRPASNSSSSAPTRFPGTITVEYVPGEHQEFQISLYRFRLSNPAATSVPASLFTSLKEEDRIGTVEFIMEYLGLAPLSNQSGLNVTTGEEAAEIPALVEGAGRLYTEEGRPNILHMELAIAHDVSTRAHEQLHASNATVTLSVDASRHTVQPNPNVVVVPRQHAHHEPKLHSGYSSSPDAHHAHTSISTPADAVPDAQDVDVAGQDQDSAELLSRLITMMEQGQTFIYFCLGSAPKKQKLFYRNPHPKEENLPGFLYLCEVNLNPREINVTTLTQPTEMPQVHYAPDGRTWNITAVFDACSITDIYLGKQAPAFHVNGQPIPLSSDDDDTLSFSLVTASSASLNVEALTAKQRAAWILGIMGILKNPEEQDGDDQTTE